MAPLAPSLPPGGTRNPCPCPSVWHTSTASANLRHHEGEAIRVSQLVILRRAVIEPENLLVDVVTKVERLHGNVGAALCPVPAGGAPFRLAMLTDDESWCPILDASSASRVGKHKPRSATPPTR
jgi:hypothetical protein